jgi:DUF4097 and DUF4098 domain-containing protein YvlB
VEIKNLIGTVTVTGWDRNEVTVTGELGDGPERLDFEQEGRRTRIEVVWPERTWEDEDEDDEDYRRDKPTVLEVRVPLKSALRVEGVNTGVDVTGVEGLIEVETVNGGVTVSGGKDELALQTVNGDIEIESDAERVDAQAVNGDILLRRGGEEISLNTVSGHIRARGEGIRRASFNSVSGSIDFEATIDLRARLDLNSHSGDIEVRLPRDVSAEFNVNTFSGDVENGMGPPAKATSKYAPGKELRFRTGDGDAHISINTFSGDIRIYEQK